jgi:hypothetical protein
MIRDGFAALSYHASDMGAWNRDDSDMAFAA